ncbi:hypothetical protein UFOVP235_16 [uncultured Caudovirales phage]|uniref:Uncharacterized protein n=1 Tax=uncultured Caudovirales phage TaxID=2100421 RepID=A0A6J7WR83_9CAUD|nr:hypothetical protein UFOVP235_16 [uncultured Caudovirales phage]
MFTSENVWTHDKRSPFATAFLIGPEKITIRTFHEVTSQGDGYMLFFHDRTAAVANTFPADILLSDAEATALFNSHEEPFTVYNGQCIVNGSNISEDLAGRTFVQMDAMTIAASNTFMGHSYNTDRCVIMWMVSLTGVLSLPENRTITTEPGRLGKDTIYLAERRSSILTLYLPFADSPWTSGQLVIKGNPAFGRKIIFENQEQITPQVIGEDEASPFVFPTLTMSTSDSISPDGYATITISCQMPNGDLRTDCNSEVFLEPIVGVLPKSRVTLTNGTATFRVSALGLQSGETIRVKAGWRYFPGLAEITLPVTAA